MNKTTVKFHDGPNQTFNTISINPVGSFMQIIEQVRGQDGNLTRTTCIPANLIKSVVVEQQN